MLRLIFTLLLLLTACPAFALPYYCAAGNYYTDNIELCNKFCGGKCEEVSPSQATYTPCDTDNYDSFIYSKEMGRTFAAGKFPITSIAPNTTADLAVISDGHAWIAAYAVTHHRDISVMLGYTEIVLNGAISHTFNVITPPSERFISSQGKAFTYTGENRKTLFYDTEPNNAYPGEPYIIMDATGHWLDAAFMPGKYYELRQWNGPLQCVAGVANVEKVDLLDEYRKNICSGDADCFACFTSDSEETALDDMRRCDVGSLHHNKGNSHLCTDGRKSCTPPGTTCEEMGAIELETEKDAYCAVEPEISCPASGSYSISSNTCDYVSDSKCDTGYTFNPNTKECQLVPLCNSDKLAAQAVFNPASDSCIAENVYNCPSGYTLNGNICETTNIKCPTSEYAYDPTNRGCKSVKPICPTPLTYNQTTGKCETTPTCPSGSAFDIASNKCIKSIADSYQCKESTGAIINSGYPTINACNNGCKTVKDISPAYNFTSYQTEIGQCKQKQITGIRLLYECWFGDEPQKVLTSNKTYYTAEACTAGCNRNIPVLVPRYPFQIILTTTINQHSFKAWCVRQVGSRQNTQNFGITETYKSWYNECGEYWDQEGNISRTANGVKYYNTTHRSTTGYSVSGTYPNLSCTGICPTGLAYNSQTSFCEAEAGNLCSAGIYNHSTHKCETGDRYFAMGYTYTLGNYSYTEPVCSDGAVFDKAGGKCKFSLYEAATSSYRVFASNSTLLASSEKIFAPCEAGYTYNYNAKTCVKSGICFNQNGSVDAANGLCLSKNKLSCPENYTVIREGLCQAPPSVECGVDFILNTDTVGYDTAMNNVNGLCMRKDESAPVCPIDENIQCVDTDESGTFYCSPYECFDYDNSIEHTETQEGATDLGNDGDPNKCEFLMSNGRDSRCRMRGADTLWHNCCAFDTAEANAYYKEDRDAGLLFQQHYLTNPLGNYIKTEKFWDYAIIAAWDSGYNLMAASFHAAEIITKFVGLGCTERDMATAEKVSSDQPICQRIGDYCVSSLFKTCIQRKATYCCYSSMFDLAFAKAARNSIEGFSFGSATSPNCRGITIDEFKKIDWNDQVVKDAFTAVIEYYAKDIAKSLDNDTLNAVMDDVRERLIIEWEQ